ncbi:MAG TPA: tetratricopeptide repeat protein [Pirellulales bacterium]|nr:tetratricopeptide repeat protein [Pirellulales bacterium]
MNLVRRALVGWGLCLWAIGPARGDEKPVDELLAEAKSTFERGQPEAALKLASRAVESDPKNARAVLVRGLLYEALAKHAQALADFNAAIELDPRHAEAYDHRGSEQFKLAKIDASIADFDKAIELDPARERGHWKRGISYYYARKYDLGRKQFESYQTFDDNDVENAVWRYLCMARGESVDKARRSILKIKDDPRVPMMQVHALYAGRATPDDVLAAAQAGGPSPEELNQRMFYVELYLGLYFEAAGDRKRAAEHLEAAIRRRIGHYMWDVAWVHVELLRRAGGAEGKQDQGLNLQQRQECQEFEDQYALPDGAALKRIAPPFMDQRETFIRVAMGAPSAKTASPGAATAVLRWQNDHLLPMSGELFYSAEFVSLGEILWSLTGLMPPEVEADEKLLETPLSGDFVARFGETDEKIVATVEGMLRDDFKLPIRLRFRTVKQPVIVASGDFVFTPLPEYPRSIQIYLDKKA